MNCVSSQIVDLVRCILQGGEASPILFNSIAHGIISALRNMGIGSTISITDSVDLFIACLMFGDDLAILATNLKDMQQLIVELLKIVYDLTH